MVELRYDKKAVDAGQKPGAGSVAAQGLLQPEALILALPLLAIYGLSQSLSRSKQQTQDLKTVNIDSCGSCHSFWFDKNELQELANVGQFAEGAIEQLYSKESGHVEVAKHGSEVTPGVSTVSVAEKEPNHLTSGNKIFVDGRWVPDPAFEVEIKDLGHVEVSKHGSEATPGVSTVSVAEKGTRPSPGVKTKKE